MASLTNQTVPQLASPDPERRFSPEPLEKETKFCIRMKTEIESRIALVSFKIIPGLMKFFVKFNYRPFEPIDDLLRELNENMGELQNEG